jgi:hypothetical protein
MSVLDLGGVPAGWAKAPVQPKSVVCVNLIDKPTCGVPGLSMVVADVFDLPSDLRSKQFDLVYCSSLIEHVGGLDRRRALASLITEMGDHHWVQAPYRYFPIEPHWLFPGFQFLPLRAKVAVSRHWNLGAYSSTKERASAVRLVLEVELPSITDFRYLFPTSEIALERVAGLPKSIIAVR